MIKKSGGRSVIRCWHALRVKADLWPVLDAENIDDTLNRAMENLGLPVRLFVEVEKEQKKKSKKNKASKVLMSFSGPAAFAPPGFLSAQNNAAPAIGADSNGVMSPLAQPVGSVPVPIKRLAELQSEVRRTMDTLARIIGQVFKTVGEVSTQAQCMQPQQLPLDIRSSLDAQITSLIEAKAAQLGILPPNELARQQIHAQDNDPNVDEEESDKSESSEGDSSSN